MIHNPSIGADDSTRFPRTIAPYGQWPTPISASTLTADTVDLADPRLDSHGLWWLERRATEAGRTVLVHLPNDADTGTEVDISPIIPPPPGSDAPTHGTPLDVRTTVHEYGGMAYAVSDGVVVASHVGDGRLVLLTADSDVVVPLTKDLRDRFGDIVIDPVRMRAIAVRERHGHTVTNELVAVPLDGSAATDDDAVTVLVTGFDFVTSPAISDDGATLAWVVWNHPEMPWTGGQVMVGLLDEAGDLTESLPIAGGQSASNERAVAAMQPLFMGNGDLIHVDDSTGWLNLYRTQEPGTATARTRPIHPVDAEFSPPQWGLGPRTIARLDADNLLCSWVDDGQCHLGSVRVSNGETEEWVTGFSPLGTISTGEGRAVFLAGAPDRPASVTEVTLGEGHTRIITQSAPRTVPSDAVSWPEHLSWPGWNDAEAHGWYYPPTSHTHTGPSDEQPPLVVMMHGGPTAMTDPTFRTSVQWWTTRGIAVLDVNYSGSTGYGRQYQDRLDRKWGIRDVIDCVRGAKWCANQGLADATRVAIRGGSAGGFTTLAAMSHSDVFTVGASWYGIADLLLLAEETHKFESKYLDRLIGQLPESRQDYVDRSPLNRVGKITAPLLILQGSEDMVVPPNQAELIASALRGQGGDVELVMFSGEGHGFVSKDAIETSTQAELEFFLRVWQL